MHKRRSIAWLVAVAVGLMLIPAAGASASDVSAAYNKKDKKAEKKQNARITRVVKAGAKLAKTVADQSTKIAGANAAILAEGAKSNGIDDRLKVIEGAAPQIIKGLGDLKDASLALKAGLETAGAGLTSLKTLATSQEYGIGQVIVLTPGPSPQVGSFVETPDIPDAVQQAQTTQQFVATSTGNLAVAYGVRSNESDGTGAAKPAAVCKVTVTNEGGTTETTLPNAALGGQPFQPVNNKSAMTSTTPANAGFPFGLKTDNTAGDADQTTTFVSSVAVTNGDTYTVGLSCVDTSPDATDPSA
jgi:hypothetical protein